MADGREWVIFFPRRFGRVFAGLAVNLVELFSLVIIGLEVTVLQRPFRGKSIFVYESLKVFLAQPEKCGSVDFRVAANEVTKSRMNFSADFVVHRLGGVILERTMIAPIVLLTREKRPALKHEDALAAGCEPVQQCSSAGARADDNEVEVFRHPSVGRRRAVNLTGRLGLPGSPSSIW